MTAVAEVPNQGATIPRREPLLDTVQAAERLGIVKQTLCQWRLRGIGPRFVKLGSAVRYHPADIDAFLDANLRTSTTDKGHPANAARA